MTQRAGFFGGRPCRRCGRPSTLRMYAAMPSSPAILRTASRSSGSTGMRKSTVAGICGFLFGMGRNDTRQTLARKPGGVITKRSKTYIAIPGKVYYDYTIMEWNYDDGGREAAGFKGDAGDCAVRAIAIATGVPYREVYDAINRHAEGERKGTRKRGVSNARTGVYRTCVDRYMRELGWTWTPTMQIGQGCKVHLRADELPRVPLVACVSKHYTAVIDGVIHDTHDPSRDGTRCVYGYYMKGGQRA